MKLCTGISELNHRSVVQKHTLAKKGNVMEKGRSEAPRGMLFEGILEPLGRQTVENGGSKNTLSLCDSGVLKRGRGDARIKRLLGGVVLLIDLN